MNLRRKRLLSERCFKIIIFCSSMVSSFGFDFTIYENEFLAASNYNEYLEEGLTAPRRDEFTPFAFTDQKSSLSFSKSMVRSSALADGSMLNLGATAFVAGSPYTALTVGHGLYFRELSAYAQTVTFGGENVENTCDMIFHKNYHPNRESKYDYAVIYYRNQRSMLATGNPLSVAFNDSDHIALIRGRPKSIRNYYIAGFPQFAGFQYYEDDTWWYDILQVRNRRESQKMIYLRGGARNYHVLNGHGISPYFNGHEFAPISALSSRYKNLGASKGFSGSPMIASELELSGAEGESNQGRKVEFATGIAQAGGPSMRGRTGALKIEEPSVMTLHSDYRMQTLMINTALQIMGKQHEAEDFPVYKSEDPDKDPVWIYNAAKLLGAHRIGVNQRTIPPNTPTLLATTTLDFARNDQTAYKNTMPGLILPWLIWEVNNEEHVGQADVQLSLRFVSHGVEYRTDYSPPGSTGYDPKRYFDLTDFDGATGRGRVLYSIEMGRPFEIWITSKVPIYINNPLLLKHIERTY